MNVERKMRAAVRRLLIAERELLEADVSERTIAAKLGAYMEPFFRSWDVDVEYNRMRVSIRGGAEELLGPKRVGGARVREGLVIPDVIVHRRNVPRNFLAIELKKKPSEEQLSHDVRKMKQMLRWLHYRHGLVLAFRERDGRWSAEYRWL